MPLGRRILRVALDALPMPTALTYSLFDPTACGYGTPKVPLLPRLTIAGLGLGAGNGFAPVGVGRSRAHYRYGRYALTQAYRLCGVGPGGALLAPAYHCRTMIDPALHLQAPVLLYPLDEALRPDLAALERLRRASAEPVKALLLTHYFGFAQDVAPFHRWCEQHGIALIEDCSHALFNRRGAERLGQAGRYTIASPYKFFPCEEAGWLVGGSAATWPPTPRLSPGWKAPLRVLDVVAARARQARRMAPLVADLGALRAELDALQRDPGPLGSDRLGASAAWSSLYVPADEPLANAWSARAVAALCDHDALALARRANHARWQAAVAGLPGCRPLFATLPDDTVPYMFGLVVERAPERFHLLKRLGMPIWRWDEMAESDCPVSSAYRLSCLHLPCHQSLSEAELAWMIAAVSEVLTRVQ